MSDFTEKVRAMLDAATPGPWHITSSNDPHWMREVRHGDGFSSVAWCGHNPISQAHKDARFIAAAPTLLREACERIEKQEKVVEAARDIVTYGSVEPDKGMDGDTIVDTWRFAVMQDALSALDAKE